LRPLETLIGWHIPALFTLAMHSVAIHPNFTEAALTSGLRSSGLSRVQYLLAGFWSYRKGKEQVESPLSLSVMCGRCRLSRRKQIIAEHFEAIPCEETLESAYNIAPKEPWRVLPMMRWRWFHPGPLT